MALSETITFHTGNTHRTRNKIFYNVLLAAVTSKEIAGNTRKASISLILILNLMRAPIRAAATATVALHMYTSRGGVRYILLGLIRDEGVGAACGCNALRLALRCDVGVGAKANMVWYGGKRLLQLAINDIDDNDNDSMWGAQRPKYEANFTSDRDQHTKRLSKQTFCGGQTVNFSNLSYATKHTPRNKS